LAKEKTQFVCQSCGYITAKWLGRCTECGEWNTFLEERPTKSPDIAGLSSGGSPIPLPEIKTDSVPRFMSRIGEFDRVLGGGVVPGSLVLVGGDPGIGKSTLLLQAAGGIADDGNKILYISGEESAQQVKMRSDRLGINGSSLYLATETCFETIRDHILQLRPRAVIIDSIQTTYSLKIPSTPGSLTQVREVAAQFLMLSKMENFTTFLVGHVTKEGAIAGPRTMEHMVDTVLYLEGDRYHSFRLLRSVKNRFGPTNEIGVFEMRPEGLKEVENPSELFLSERRPDCPGSTVVPTMEGSRPILAEIQALVSPSGYGMARRASTGVDLNRISLLISVIEKRLEIPLSGQDILVNAAGGIRVEEPALDLAMIAAILSSFKNRAVPPDLVICGEVGLGGEARAIGQVENRVGEASKLGFKRCILPENSRRKLPRGSFSMELLGVSQIHDLKRILFS